MGKEKKMKTNKPERPGRKYFLPDKNEHRV